MHWPSADENTRFSPRQMHVDAFPGYDTALVPHGRHDVCPVSALYDPAVQLEHCDASNACASVPNVPLGQPMGTPVPWGQYVPAVHGHWYVVSARVPSACTAVTARGGFVRIDARLVALQL